MIFLPSVLRAYRFRCVLLLAAFAVTTVFLTVATGALRDGLYWPALSGEDGSPLGEFATSAAEQGYSVEGKRWAPYQGYYYKILFRQGPNAPGGEVDYMVSGDMVGGFALVAYPAQYRRSGLMIPRQSSGDHLREGPRHAHHRYRHGNDEL